MNGESARQGAPDNNDHPPPRLPARRADVPRVAVVIALEATPTIIIDAASEADRAALRAWVRLVRPDIDCFLRGIAREIHERKAA